MFESLLSLDPGAPALGSGCSCSWIRVLLPLDPGALALGSGCSCPWIQVLLPLDPGAPALGSGCSRPWIRVLLPLDPGINNTLPTPLLVSFHNVYVCCLITDASVGLDHSILLTLSDIPTCAWCTSCLMQEGSAPKDLGRAIPGAREQQRLQRVAWWQCGGK